jgi:signal transduction histidine kinase
MGGSWLLRKINMGLRNEIVLNILVLVVASLLVIGITLLKTSERNILAQRIASSKLILSEVQRTVEDFWSTTGGNWRQLSKALRQFAPFNDIQGVWIVDTDMKISAAFGAGEVNRVDLRKALESGVQESRVESTGRLWWSFYRRVLLTAPVTSDGARVGAVQVAFSLADMTERLIVLRRSVLMLILVDALVLILFGGFLMSRVVVNPLKRLATVAERIREGDLEQRAPVESDNEIGELATTLNQMLNSLAEKQRSLEVTIDELTRTQRELVISEKLGSVGRLAAGVAHEIGNPLASILGYTEMLKKKLAGDGPLHDMADRAHHETQRIDGIIRSLLQFSRPTDFKMGTIDVGKIIHDSLELVKVQKLFRDIAVDVDVKEALPPVRGNSDQLQQVLINLFMNAADAMPNGGTLSVRGRGEGTSVLISVQDTGTGIAPEELDKVFDPFYTTKSPDKGTGLGLSVSLQIIESFGGAIKVASTPDQGSTFTVVLHQEDNDLPVTG